MANSLANIRSLPLQLDAFLENRYMDQLLDGKPRQENDRQIFVQSTRDEPLLRPSLTLEPIKRDAVLAQVRRTFEKKAADLFHQDPKSLESDRQKIEQKMSYPETVLMHHALGSCQIVETTAAQLLMAAAVEEVNVQAESVDQTETVSTQFAWATFLSGKAPLRRTPTIIPHPISRYHPDLAKSPLQISENALCTFTGDTVKRPGFLNGYAKPLHYIAEISPNQFVLIDTQEAAELLDTPSQAISLWLIGCGFLFGRGDPAQMARFEADVKKLGTLRDIPK